MSTMPTTTTSRGMSGEEFAGYIQALNHHQVTDQLHRLVYVCLECHSVGLVGDDGDPRVDALAAERDKLVKLYDFTCCNPATTITHHTTPDEEPGTELPRYSRTDFDAHDGFPYPR